MNKISPFLWFDGNAEEAVDFYLSVFPHARKGHVLRSPGVGPMPAGGVITVAFELEGLEITALNGGPAHKPTPAFSLVVKCDTQEEIDRYWARFQEGGKEMACGWIQDKFGFCWQIVPKNIFELVKTPAGMKAMMGMVKFDIAALEAAGKA